MQKTSEDAIAKDSGLLGKIECSKCDIQIFLKDHVWRDFVTETKLGWAKCVIDFSRICLGHRTARTKTACICPQ